MSPELIALHMGAMHPVEKVLTLLLAFGPFLVLAAVIVVRRRQDADAPDQVEPPSEREGP